MTASPSGKVTFLGDISIPVCETGRVEVSFSGGPAGGRYAGTDSWQPQGTGDLDLLTYRIHGRTVRAASLALGGSGGPLQSAVGRSAAPGQTTACSDLSNGPAEGFFTPRVRGRRITLNLVSGFPLLGTRCAGPLDVDLGSALPAVTLSLSRVIHGRLRIDLRGAHRFSAHGFSGVVRSTLVLRLGRAKTTRQHPPSPGPTSGRLTRIVNVNYRVHIAALGGGSAHLHGALVADLTQTQQCRDATTVSEAQVLLEARGDHVQVSLSPAQSQAADPLRTRCPGPELGDNTLTSATLPRSALRRRTLTVALHGRSFRDGPYAVRTRSTLVLTLRRVRVSTQTYRLPSAPSPPRCAQSSSCPS